MASLTESYEDLLAFMDLGGQVAWPLAFVACAMWTIIVDRFWYVWFGHPKALKVALQQWQARSDRGSWYSTQIRRRIISEIMTPYERGLVVLGSLIAVCPLMGLLGTVMGMLEVFDVVALSGNGNVRAMASGVSQATVSTMMGMVVALSGLYFGERLRRGAQSERRRVEDLLGTT
ncbi:MAG: MotA/TolQ/ExbB proton channel family protein [Deltaproteobacteria bacterium]|nr:MotA/TolQ/ExbB proton channel family protein [Deltaproteobacteria bacterium]